MGCMCYNLWQLRKMHLKRKHLMIVLLLGLCMGNYWVHVPTKVKHMRIAILLGLHVRDYWACLPITCNGGVGRFLYQHQQINCIFQTSGIRCKHYENAHDFYRNCLGIFHFTIHCSISIVFFLLDVKHVEIGSLLYSFHGAFKL